MGILNTFVWQSLSLLTIEWKFRAHYAKARLCHDVVITERHCVLCEMWTEANHQTSVSIPYSFLRYIDSISHVRSRKLCLLVNPLLHYGGHITHIKKQKKATTCCSDTELIHSICCVKHGWVNFKSSHLLYSSKYGEINSQWTWSVTCSRHFLSSSMMSQIKCMKL
jgi:hypothetical protein